MAGFDPDAYLAQKEKKTKFDPDAYLSARSKQKVLDSAQELGQNLRSTLENAPEEGFLEGGIRRAQERMSQERQKGVTNQLIDAVSYPQATLLKPLDDLVSDFTGSRTGLPEMMKRGQDTLTFNTWGKGLKKILNYANEGGAKEVLNLVKNQGETPIYDRVSNQSEEEYKKDTEEHPIATGLGTVGGMVLPFSASMKALESVPLLKKVKDAPKLLEAFKTLLRGGIANTGISQLHNFDPDRAPLDFGLGAGGEVVGAGVGKGFEKGANFLKERAPELMNYILKTPLKLLKKGNNLGKEAVERGMIGTPKRLLKQAEEGLQTKEDALQSLLDQFEAKPRTEIDLPSYLPEEIPGTGAKPGKPSAFVDSPTFAEPEDLILADRENQALLQRLQKALERQAGAQSGDQALQQELENRLLKMGEESQAALQQQKQSQADKLKKAADVYYAPKPFEGVKTESGSFPSRPFEEPPPSGNNFIDDFLASLKQEEPSPTILRKQSAPAEEGIAGAFKPTPGTSPREFVPPRERTILSPEDFIDPERSLTPRDFEPAPPPAPKGTLVDKQKLLRELEDVKRSYRLENGQALPGRQADIDAINSYIDEVRNLDDMTPAQANRMKRRIYELRQKSYGKEVIPVKADLDIATARGLKKAIEEVAPESKNINQDLRFFGQLRDTLENTLAKNEKPDLSLRGLFDRMLGGTGGTATAVGMDRAANVLNYLRMLQLQNLLTRSATQIPAISRQGASQ